MCRDAWADGLGDPDLPPIAEWAAAHVIVPDGPRQGRLWSPELTPYLLEPLEVLHPDHPATRVSVKKSAQLGVSILAILWLMYLMDRCPARLMYVQPTRELVAAFGREKLDPMLAACDALNGKVREQKQREAGASQALFKVFRGGFLVLTGANSSAGLRMRTIQYIVGDEVDDWPADLDGQGAPMEMVDARQISFHRSGRYKKLELSTPAFAGASQIDDGYEDSDQRLYHVRCPLCGHEQVLNFKPKHADPPRGGLVWDAGRPDTAVYVCERGCTIEPWRLPAMIQPENGARWIATKPGPGRHPGFHLHAVYSLLTTWAKMVEKYEDIKGDEKKEKTFFNLWLGLSYALKADAPDIALLMAVRQDYAMGRFPAGAVFATGFTDVQANRLEWAVYGWGPGGASWLMDRGVIPGDPAGNDVWREHDKVVRRAYEAAGGKRWPADAWGVDTGYMTQRVYLHCRSSPRLFACDGRPGALAPPLGLPKAQDVDWQGKRYRGGVSLWPVGTWAMKAELMAALRRTVKGPDENGVWPVGCAFYPIGYTEDEFKQLTSETLVTEDRPGGRKALAWKKVSKDARNEQLDLYVGARALAEHLGLSRLEPHEWEKLAAERGAPPDRVQMDLAALWAPGFTGPAVADAAGGAGTDADDGAGPARGDSATAADGGAGPARDAADGGADGWIDQDEARGWMQ